MKTWAETYNQKNLRLIVEATTYCNAKCPQCIRTNRNGLDKNEFDLNSWSVEDFISYFNIEDLNHIHNIHFSGTYGDPGMCKDIYEIIQYIFESSKTTNVSLNTNGSMRDEDWWFKLGCLDKDRISVVFDIDGINQEMHEKYRRNTDLEKVLNNMESYAYSGAKTKILTIIFKHNEEYYDDIVAMAKSRGATEYTVVQSNRFKNGPTWDFINDVGDIETLEQSVLQRFKPNPTALSRRVRDYRTDYLVNDYDYITCVKAEAGSLQILNDTTVYPCCYLGTYNEKNPSGVWKEFLDSELTLKKKTLKEIVNHSWYTETLFNSLKDRSKALIKCKRICSMKKDIIATG